MHYTYLIPGLKSLCNRLYNVPACDFCMIHITKVAKMNLAVTRSPTLLNTFSADDFQTLPKIPEDVLSDEFQ